MSGRLELRRLGKRFGAATALDSFSLDIEAGRITTLLGPSGCGKTTALRIIAGFLEADSGDVLLDGRSLRGLPPFRRDTAMVFQDFALFPHMTVLENVSYGLRFRRLSAPEIRSRVDSILGFLQLDHLRERLPHELSGGQQQRVALGRALAVRPRVLLMDEPLSNLDARLRASVRSEFRRIQQELGVTTVFVTHDQDEALSLGDTVAVMDAGQLVESGAPRELYRLPQTRFAAFVLGEANFLEPGAVHGLAEVSLQGQKLTVSSALTAVPARPLLMLRPHDISVGAGGGTELTARFESVEFRGSSERCTFRLEDQDCVVQADLPAGTELPQAGDLVTLSIAPGRAVLLAG